MPNRLAHETSPYLLQHANNPVDWYPWGDEALARARQEDKPIFLSIGYSACHWCHVMEHESFENPDIARAMNESFINIKVDREERPDLDQIYMNAVQMLTGRGGWPMSVFLTPDLKPFYGGTYWPPRTARGMPGFDQVLAGVAEAWRQRRETVLDHADKLTAGLQELGDLSATSGRLSDELFRAAESTLERIFDGRHGGFGGAPKFPHPMDMRLLLRIARRRHSEPARQMVALTLDKMAAGGIYDQLGGGFHRYSVDERWLVPHFEKMLYDNALLAVCYAEAYQAIGRADYLRVVRETLDYLLREMTSPEGGFYSTQDADSEGVEGKFYVWRPAEIERVLGAERARTFCYVYDITEQGNFEGHNILNLPKSLAQCAQLLGRDETELHAELAECRRLLLAERNGRVWPGRDDKILASWNALAIEAFAMAGALLNEPRYVEASRRAADFLLGTMHRDDGRLLHAFCQGQARLDAYLDDYAYLAHALTVLYESTFETRWIDEACRLADVVLARFADPSGAGFYYTADDHEQLVARNKDVQDSSVPSGNAMAATLLVKLAHLTGRAHYATAAEQTLTAFAHLMERSPTATGQMLLALDLHLGPTYELVFVPAAGAAADDAETAALLSAMRPLFLPNKVLACSAPGSADSPLAELFAGRAPSDEPTLHVCQGFSCQAPARGSAAIQAALEALAAN